jgi:hypothetical protein
MPSGGASTPSTESSVVVDLGIGTGALECEESGRPFSLLAASSRCYLADSCDLPVFAENAYPYIFFDTLSVPNLADWAS